VSEVSIFEFLVRLVSIRYQWSGERASTKLVDRAGFVEKQDERTNNQHCNHQNLELTDDRDDGGLLGDHVIKFSMAWVLR
jgi:hypothetical protein